MRYHPAFVSKLIPFPSKPVFPDWLNLLNLIYDAIFVLFFSLRSARFWKATCLAWTVWRSVDFERKAEASHADPQKLSLTRHVHAKELYRQLNDLGGAFIKVGQFIATREDLVPKEYIEELSQLQDSVPPIRDEEIQAVLRRALGEDPVKLFRSIEAEPLASASIAQVHKAVTKEGVTIVLKIQKPNLGKLFLEDLAIVRTFSCFFDRHSTWAKHRFWPQICDEFGKVLFEEIDFVHEAINAERMRLNLIPDHPNLIIPRIHWDFVKQEVLAMEYVPSLKLTDRQVLLDLHINPKKIAEELLSIFLDQLFKHHFFHADPHQGNLGITEEGKLVLYDYGMTYKIDELITRHFKEAILAIVSQDTDRLVQALDAMNLIRPGADLNLIKTVIQKTTFKYYSGSRLQDLYIDEIKDDINRMIASSPIRMPPTLAYVFRTAGILEGLCRSFDSNFNFINSIQPYTRKWIVDSKDASMIEKALSKLAERFDIPALNDLMALASLPSKAKRLLQKMEQGDINIPVDFRPLQQRIVHIEQITQGIALLFVGTIFLGSAGILWQVVHISPWISSPTLLIGLISFGVGLRKIF
ncbi:MAG: AarF/UbiB family protein [Candidatus Caenarcaniphilales bacterium]|nr:AarF/UbiB family protein [Candidatus Caenarcaniphilales bacterium]